MTYRLELKLLGVPTPGRNARRVWQATHRDTQAWRRAVAFGATGRTPPKPLRRARVVFKRFGERELDFTNLVDSFKALEDGLVGAGILADDKPANYVGGHPDYAQERVARGREHVTIVVTGETPADAEDCFDHAERSRREEGGPPR